MRRYECWRKLVADKSIESEVAELKSQGYRKTIRWTNYLKMGDADQRSKHLERGSGVYWGFPPFGPESLFQSTERLLVGSWKCLDRKCQSSYQRNKRMFSEGHKRNREMSKVTKRYPSLCRESSLMASPRACWERANERLFSFGGTYQVRQVGVSTPINWE